MKWASLAYLVYVILLVLHKSPPPAVTVDPAAVARVQQKFEAAAEAKSAGESAQVQLDSTELNSYLAQNLQLAGSPVVNASANGPSDAAPQTTPVSDSAPVASPSASAQPSVQEVQSSVRDVKVDMEGDLVEAYVVFDSHGKDLSLELEGRLSAENGYMKFEPVAGKLGSLPLPQSVLNAAVDKMMDSPENRDKLRLPEDVSNIQIRDSQVVISYK